MITETVVLLIEYLASADKVVTSRALGTCSPEIELDVKQRREALIRHCQAVDDALKIALNKKHEQT